MTQPAWWKWEVTPGNLLSILSTLVAIVVAFVWVQADVMSLKKADEIMDKRMEKVENRAEQDRATISEIRGDIRVIRQILEGTPRRNGTPAP